jgi:hypothetical protein
MKPAAGKTSPCTGHSIRCGSGRLASCATSDAASRRSVPLGAEPRGVSSSIDDAIARAKPTDTVVDVASAATPGRLGT